MALSPEQIEQLKALIGNARACHARGALADARRMYELARGLLPTAVELQVELGRVLMQMNLPVDAAACFRRATALQPRDPVCHFNLGNALADCRDYDEAYAAYRRALALKPDFVAALNNLGNALMLLFHFEEAEETLRRAIALKPDHALAHVNLADALWGQKRFAEAMASYDEALRLAPEMPEAHLHRSIALLLQGRLREGFAEQEWRWRANSHLPMQRIHLPRWQGEPLAGKTILLHGEQGFGDDIQFVRFLPRIKALGARVLLRVEPDLVRLLSTIAGVDAVYDTTTPVPEADYAVSLLSLAQRLDCTLETIPATVPYLAANPADVAAWAEKLAERPGRKVGLAWAGAPRPGLVEAVLLDSRRSTDLATFAPLAAVPGIALISLQKGPKSAQALIPPPGMAITHRMDEVTDFADCAALVQNLDLVITVDTAVAHVAGALGKPFWLLNRHDGCWRWLIERSDSPWYPSARIFRQQRRGDWSGVIAEMAAALADWAKTV